MLPALERAEQSAAVARVRHSVTLLEEHGATHTRSDPWQYLEYCCHACVLRMGWPGHAPAFLDPEYDDHIRQILEIEGYRYATPRVTPGG